MFKIAYHTLGCKVNQYETEKTREALESAGFETVPFASRADACVINTCSVTQVADSKSRAAIRRALRLNPEAYVVVSGCYADLEPSAVGSIEGVDLVVAHGEKESLPERIIAHFGQANPQSAIRTPQSVRPRTRTRAVVKVQDGCDQFCAYCVVPYARSGRTSRPLTGVVEELRMLAEFGYKEIVLAGIRLGSYHDESIADRELRIADLIERAAQVHGIERIRLSSIEPWEVDDALLDAMAHPKVCRHLHIPLQSGDDGVLRRMNRPHDSARYREIIERVRTKIPGIGVTTDVIVGFPGEDDAAFDNTCRMIEAIEYSRLHVFRYSARRRTAAASMPDQVQPGVKKLRAEKLIELGKLAMTRFASSLVGRTMAVLVESEHVSGINSRNTGSEAVPTKYVTGFTDNYVEVKFPGDSSIRGEVVPVKITGIDQNGIAKGIVDWGREG
ncbi:MAG: tRNA (N(6)-L-threonylcarbamoyladenosine(37)-C(2))-methylthiotransferase MtaB [Armatimonadetes bacterium]|nr:tRNA (N(6)-L-threonylcarbamoyladenosine(37)-C(2))-methylthiotransferase MtaB [Armatimonadota bacterium]